MRAASRATHERAAHCMPPSAALLCRCAVAFLGAGQSAKLAEESLRGLSAGTEGRNARNHSVWLIFSLEFAANVPPVGLIASVPTHGGGGL